MKTRYLSVYILLALLFLISPIRIQAQLNPHASVTRGEKGVFYLLNGAVGSRDAAVSADGNYVSGDFTDGTKSIAGYIYDIAKDTTWITTPSVHLVSPDWYAGGSTIYKNGELLNVETRSGLDPSEQYAHTSIWAATPDLSKIMSLAYEQVEDPLTGEPMWVNFAYVVDGTSGKIIERVKPHWPMSTNPNIDNRAYGERVNGCNANGTILVGHSSLPGNFTNWSPVFWDLENDTSFSVGDPADLEGSLESTNNDGSVILGMASKKSILIHYDKAELSYTVEEIPYSPGKSFGILPGMSENGLVLFLQQSSGADPGSRQSYIYNMKDKSVTLLDDYIKELYGIEPPVPCFSASFISDDGRIISGWALQGGEDIPFLIIMDENQLFARPRNFYARQNLNTMQVELQWLAPMAGQYQLLGYNVYCDSVKLNEELIDASTCYFVQSSGIESGVHEYSVQAVYQEGVSDYADGSEILVVSDGGCLPVQTIGSDVRFNRYVEVFWDIPSSQKSNGVKDCWKSGNLYALDEGGVEGGQKSATVKSYYNKQIDLMRFNALNEYTISSAIVVGDRIYASDYNKNTISEYDYQSLNLIGTYEVEGVKCIYNMVHWNGKLYLASGNEEILEWDRASMSVSNRIKTKEGVSVRHLAYISELDGSKGGFAYGDWHSLHYCGRYGQTLDIEKTIDIDGLSISGTVYHEGLFYILSQSGSQKDELYVVDFSNKVYMGKKILSENSRVAGIEPVNGFIAGGMGLGILPDSTVALMTVLQFKSVGNHIAWWEIESAPDLLGYNLYRNGVRMNPEGEYIQGLSYADTILTPGVYVYTVEAVNKNGCSNMLETVKTEVSIAETGSCPGPEDLHAVESNHSVHLDWNYESEDGPRLVGFRVYRNDELLSDNLLDLKYDDYNLEKGNYVYRIEAYHENSCLSQDSIEIEVTYEGVGMPPSAFQVKLVDDNAGSPAVEASWDLPYFEEPLAIGYCQMPQRGVALQGYDSFYAVVGWDSSKLDMYRDLYLVGMEYFIGQDIKNITGLVYLNNELSYSKESSSRISENAWNTIMFDEYIPMDQPYEVVVGYKVEHEEGAQSVAVFDNGSSEEGYSDLISVDGQQWASISSMGYAHNWCINALVVKKRDLEMAKDALKKGEKTKLEVMRLGQFDLSLSEPVQVKRASSPSVKLQGFNFYRDDEKLNKEVLKDFSYRDENLEKGFHEYKVSAVYTDKEVECEPVLIDLGNLSNQKGGKCSHINVFPNPTVDRIYVKGQYTSVDIYTLTGTRVLHLDGTRKEIDLQGLTSGTYLIRFSLGEREVYVEKIVIG